MNRKSTTFPRGSWSNIRPRLNGFELQVGTTDILQERGNGVYLNGVPRRVQ